MEILSADDLLILERISDDCGHPLWELSEIAVRDEADSLLGPKDVQFKAKNKKGNLNKKLKEWERLGYVYKIKRKSTRWNTRSPNMYEYPYYINKSSDTLHKIQHCIADPIEGKIWIHDEINYVEQKKYNKIQEDYITSSDNDEGPSISDKHHEARTFITRFMLLYFWCDKIIEKCQDLLEEPNTRPSFSLINPVPPCKLCQGIQRRIRYDIYHQNRMWISNPGIWEKCLAEIKNRSQYNVYSKDFENPITLPFIKH